MTNEERWVMFINELRAYIEEHHLGSSKHTTLRNQLVYFRRKIKEGTLDPEKARILEEVLSLRYLFNILEGEVKSRSYSGINNLNLI